MTIAKNIFLLSLLITIISSCNKCAEVKEYYADGPIRKKGCLLNDKYEGRLILYYKNGNIESISNWEKGVQNGLSLHYYKNGNIKDSAYIVNDIPHGEFVQYYINGLLKKEGNYIDGKFYGKSYDYNSSGELTVVNNLSNNRPTSYLRYNQDNKTSEKWLVKVTKEDFFLDINKDTLKSGNKFKAKFILNHKIADSIRVFISSDDTVEHPAFKWPEEGSTKFDYSIIVDKPGSFSFTGYVLLYYREDLDNMAGEVKKIPFNVEYTVTN